MYKKNNKTEGKKIGNGNAAKLESVLQFNLPYYHSLELHRLCKRVIDNDLHIMSAFQSDPKLPLWLEDVERNLWPVENEINVVKGLCIRPKGNWAKNHLSIIFYWMDKEGKVFTRTGHNNNWHKINNTRSMLQGGGGHWWYLSINKSEVNLGRRVSTTITFAGVAVK